MFKHIRLIPLILGLIVGFVSVIMIKPEMNIIYKYPTPDNVDKTTYKDKNGVCYKYNATKVECDKNESRLKDFPLQS